MKNGKGKHNDEPTESAATYWIDFTIRKPLVPGDEPSEYVSDIRGIIWAKRDEAPGVEEKIGRIRASLVHMDRAYDDGESLFEIFDSIDDELHGYYATFFDIEEESLKEQFENGRSNMLIVNRIEIVPEHRGKKIGLFAMQATLDEFGGSCALAAIQPHPLAYDEDDERRDPWVARMRAGQRKTSKAAAAKALGRYWMALGFKPLELTGFLYLDLSMRQPELPEFEG